MSRTIRRTKHGSMFNWYEPWNTARVHYTKNIEQDLPKNCKRRVWSVFVDGGQYNAPADFRRGLNRQFRAKNKNILFTIYYYYDDADDIVFYENKKNANWHYW